MKSFCLLTFRKALEILLNRATIAAETEKHCSTIESKEGKTTMVDMKKIALFAAGTLFGSAGFKILSSKDAKKVYTQTTAAVLRMKDCTMETVNKVQEQAGDILADAKAINEARAAEAEAAVIEDAAEETAEPAEKTVE